MTSLQNARGEIEGVLSASVPGVVTRWFMVAEVVDEDGDAGIWKLSSESVQPWQILGLLDFLAVTIKTDIANVYSDWHDPEAVEEDE
jgi:hypothetical protein